MLTGGGSLLKNTDIVIEKATGLKVKYASDPLLSVANGSGKVLENIRTMRKSLSSTYASY